MEFTAGLVAIVVGTGLVAGFAAGFVGVGGGIVMVPILLEGFRRAGLPSGSVVQTAMGTSLAVGVFSVASSIVRHAWHRRILWRLTPALAPGSLIGGWLAARLAVILPGRYLQLGLALLMAFAAWRMFTQKDYRARETPPIRWWQAAGVGLLVGLVAGLSGLAGGIVLVPALALLLGVHTGWLAGTSSSVIIFSAGAAALSYLTAAPADVLPAGFHGFVHLKIAGLLILGAIPGAQFGAWTNRRTGSLVFRRIFAVILGLVVIRLLISL